MIRYQRYFNCDSKGVKLELKIGYQLKVTKHKFIKHTFQAVRQVALQGQEVWQYALIEVDCFVHFQVDLLRFAPKMQI